MTKRLAWSLWRIVLVVLLLGVAVRSGTLAMFNWWAAGGPPTANPAGYERLGNVFFGVAVLCCAAAVTLGVDVVRDWHRAREIGAQAPTA